MDMVLLSELASVSKLKLQLNVAVSLFFIPFLYVQEINIFFIC